MMVCASIDVTVRYSTARTYERGVVACQEASWWEGMKLNTKTAMPMILYIGANDNGHFYV